jgi:hypothetical protein
MPQPPKRKVAVKRSEPQMAEAYRAVWRSPFVRDTLGIPDGVAMEAYPTDADEFASYTPRSKTIQVNTNRDPRLYETGGRIPADKPSVRTTMAHEIGHAYGPKAFPSYPMIAEDTLPPFVPKTPREEEALYALNPYGFDWRKGPGYRQAEGSSPAEGFAQAYTNAVEFLSETAPDTTGFREKLGQYEGNTPGAGAIVRDLLSAKGIYAKHPLKRAIR